MKTCTKCQNSKGPTEFYAGKNQCKDCIRARSRAWHRDNRDRSLAAKKAWHEANREPQLTRMRNRYQQQMSDPETAERERERGRARRQSETYCQSVRENGRQWYLQNRERNAARSRQWAEENPEAAREISRMGSQRRRATKAEAAVEPFTARDLRRDWEGHDLYACFFCGGSLTDGYEVEHFYPLSKGGPHALFNLVPSCAPCNRGAGGKGTKEPWGYLREALTDQGIDLDAVQAGIEAARRR